MYFHPPTQEDHGLARGGSIKVLSFSPQVVTKEDVRILLISTTAIGDTVMATPFIRAVRLHYSKAHITVFAHYKRLSILEHNPHVNHLLPYYGKGKHLLKTLCALRPGKFDLAIVLHANDPDIVPLVRWSNAPMRVGWGESKWARLFTHTICRTDPPEHFMVHKKRLLESIGIPVPDLHTEIFLQTKDELPFHQKILPWLRKISSSSDYVVMHPFGTKTTKWWSLDHFLSMSQHIWEKQHWPTVFVGDDKSLPSVQQHSHFDPSRHIITLGCSIRESAFIIQQARRMLTTDSGPMHLAFAVRCPTLSLFGPTQPTLHGPCFDQNHHRVLYRNPLSELTLEEVIQAWDT